MSENNPELEGVMRRIQKLLAIAGDDRANPAEAAAAASMAEKVMRKYQLDHADIIASELRSKAPDVGDSAVFANMKRDDPKRPSLTKTPAWGQMLSVAIAQLYDCHVMNGVAKKQIRAIRRSDDFHGLSPGRSGLRLDIRLHCWRAYRRGERLEQSRKGVRPSGQSCIGQLSPRVCVFCNRCFTKDANGKASRSRKRSSRAGADVDQHKACRDRGDVWQANIRPKEVQCACRLQRIRARRKGRRQGRSAAQRHRQHTYGGRRTRKGEWRNSIQTWSISHIHRL